MAADVREVLAELDEQLGERRHTGESSDRAATAVVDGRGTLVTLSLSEDVLRGPHPESLGTAIVRAVHAARESAGAAYDTSLRETFADEPPPPADEDFSQRSHVRPEESW
ncbi:DNA-binding protein YbaB [Herbihabitans rhizosphaerae]|uniref:DNA-binding protein YbaB n=1 Tax=Herbihabitans rhizosphaerae TaxID=1872711 RepID=A0A4Q7L8V4_9PSEU|nr:YbaB/EbfC family nucleoid-associated protein [Herbihabitans rhizosphaerae]RZS44842.1 DNA-binding protein YbaB [Herbihabitans rhizosphaerae]